MTIIADELAGKRILVTGGYGFLGRHLVDRLLTHHALVFCASRSPPPDHRRNVTPIRGDLSEFATARSTFREARPDVTYHLTSESRGGQDFENVLPTLRNDFVATVNCLVAAKDCGGGRFVMTGSLEEPVMRGDLDLARGEPVATSPYAAAKYAAGIYGRMFRQVYGLPVVLVRPFMTYGPGQKRFKIIPYVITSLLRGEQPRISSGDRRVDWIYVDDVIDAFVMAGVAPRVEGLTFDIGSGALVPIRSVVERIHGFLGGPVPEFDTVASRTMEQTRSAQTSLAARRLGWKSKTSLDVGLLKTIASYRVTAPLVDMTPPSPRP